MSDDQTDVHDATDGGVSGTHPSAELLPVLVSPATASEFNTVRLRLIPVACWRVDDIRFDFGSSFVRPEIATEMQKLQELREKHKTVDALTNKTLFPPLSIFGHADPVGSDDMNKDLSGRRATAIFAMLIRDTGLWEGLFNQPSAFGVDKWGPAALQTMETETGLPHGTSHPTLFKAYMDKLCGPGLELKKDDFLARGADAAGKGDLQGCGEFNPLLIFSQAEDSEFEKDKDKTARNAANAPNRRVMALLFRPGSQVDPARWPCPRVKEGTAGCKKRFWSDGEKRRTLHLAERRKFSSTQDTFACRFYQRLLSNSPCEASLATVRIRLFDHLAQAIPFAPYRVIKGGVTSARKKADSNADFIVAGLELPATLVIQWSRVPVQDDAPGSTPEDEAGEIGTDPGFGGPSAAPGTTRGEFEYELEIFVRLDEDPTAGSASSQGVRAGPPDPAREAARKRLQHLGYSKVSDELEFQIKMFQRDCGKEQSGRLADADEELKTRHAKCDPPPRFGASDESA